MILLKAIVIILFTSTFVFGFDIIDLNTSKHIKQNDFITKISEAKFILLGEIHDNHFHHEIRADIIKQFKSKNLTVIAEHFDFGKKIDTNEKLLKSLNNAGFDDIGWQWPIHKYLFQTIYESGANFIGGNIPKSQKGQNDHQLIEIIKKNPLSADAQRDLENDLVEGHCNMIKVEQTKQMQLIQKKKDASMALAITEFAADINFLIAGNGHIQKNYGTRLYIESLNPSEKIISVGFLGASEFDEKNLHNYSKLWDFVVLTKDVEKEDMCKKFKKQMEKQ